MSYPAWVSVEELRTRAESGQFSGRSDTGRPDSVSAFLWEILKMLLKCSDKAGDLGRFP